MAHKEDISVLETRVELEEQRFSSVQKNSEELINALNSRYAVHSELSDCLTDSNCEESKWFGELIELEQLTQEWDIHKKHVVTNQELVSQAVDRHGKLTQNISSMCFDLSTDLQRDCDIIKDPSIMNSKMEKYATEIKSLEANIAKCEEQFALEIKDEAAKGTDDAEEIVLDMILNEKRNPTDQVIKKIQGESNNIVANLNANNFKINSLMRQISALQN